MLSETIAAKYAMALYTLAKKESKLELLENQLKEIVVAMHDNQDIEHAFKHPIFNPDAKKRIIRSAFSGQIEEHLISFLFLLIDKKREPYLEKIVEEYTGLVDMVHNAVEADVTSAVALSAAQLDSLRVNLERMTGKSVRTKTKTDGRLIGGVVVRIGDKILDGSVAYKLSRMRGHLQQIEVSG